MERLDVNYNFFKKNIDALKQKYPDEYVVITNKKVIFHTKSNKDAIDFVKTLEAGTYILQKCETIPENNIQMFHTRVTF